ncbi:MAG TPA: hypothetical protein DDY13_01820 [Cytophagales bacterium]|jgi:hemoglobin/transferrin/lactoferrin receptor protein|nr:hypothetical protein [Cytophagales bacterium]
MPSGKQIFFYVVLSLFLSAELFGQSSILSGQIVDESKKPLLGALVYMNNDKEKRQDLSGPVAQAITNAEGRFIIRVPNSDHLTLTVRHLGYATQHRSVGNGDSEFIIVLPEKPLPLDEVTISSLKGEKPYQEASVPVAVLTSDQWQNWMPRDLPEVLDNMPGVSKASDGPWANSVHVRGFGEDRLVRMIDGSRIETATDLSGALSTIDMSDVERVEVIKSGISSLYGSGALGGAINVITRSSEYNSQPYWHGSAALDYQSVNQMWAPKATLFAGGQKWNAKLHFGYRDAGDAYSPDGPIPNSRFTDWNLSGRIAVRTFENHEFSINYQKYEGSAGIPGGDNFPNSARASYLDFDRELVSLEYQIIDLLPTLKTLWAKYYHQDIFRNVEVIPNVPSNTNGNIRVTPQLLNPSATHLTNGGLIESQWVFGGRHELTVGWELWQRDLESQRTRYILQEVLAPAGNVVNSIDLIKGETPIPTSSFQSNGVFAQYNIRILPKLDFTAGGRLDRITLSNEESRDPEYLIRNGERTDNPPGQIIVYPDTSTSNTTWALHAGISYHLNEDISLTTSYGRSYRAPSLEERYKFINLGNAIEMGNPDLVPEQGNFLDAGIKINTSRIQLTGNVFINYIDKMITMAPADSVSFFISDDAGPSQKTFARRYQNINKALLSGFEVSVDWLAYSSGVAYGQLNYVRGIDRSKEENLPQIIPFNGMIGLRQKVRDAGSIDLRVRHFAAQNNVAEGEVTTDAYTLLDCFFESEPLRMSGWQLQFTAGIENITNTRYRNHLSTNRGFWMLEPGRNIKCKVSILW